VGDLHVVAAVSTLSSPVHELAASTTGANLTSKVQRLEDGIIGDCILRMHLRLLDINAQEDALGSMKQS
jgi:hypothetical protein